MKALALTLAYLTAAIGGIAGCSGEISADDAEPLPAVTTEARLAVTRVEWNPRALELNDVQAVVDNGDGLVLFGDKGTTALAKDGSLRAADESIKGWTAASVIPAQLGGEWTVGVDRKGGLHRVRENGALESIAARYGLENDHVHSVVSAGKGVTALAFNGGLLIALGYGAVRQSGVDGCDILAGGHDRVACATGDQIVVFKVGKLEQRTYNLVGVRSLAFDAHGTLVAATDRAIWMEEEKNPALALVYRTSEEARVHGLVASGLRVWIGVGTELATLDGKDVARTDGLAIAEDASLLPSSSGDVWVLSSGKLSRFTASLSPLRAQWEKDVKPLVGNICAGCHGAIEPASKIDLATYDRWLQKRGEIRDRVLVKKDMPPGSLTLTENERAGVAAWLDAADKAL